MTRAAPSAASVGTVADVMVRHPMVSPASLTVGQARALFADDHLHALLVLDERGVLLAVVERADVVAADGPHSAAEGPGPLASDGPEVLARRVGRLAGRTTGPDADAECARRDLVRLRRRRLAVVGADGRLLGLLCLKRTGLGFCSDADVRSRAIERGCDAPAPVPVPPVGLEPTLQPF